MSAMLESLLTPQQRRDAASADPIPRRSDRRAPPDADSIAALIRHMPTISSNGLATILAAVSAKLDTVARGWIDSDAAIEAIDYAHDACLSMREVTAEDLEQWAREDAADWKFEESRGN